MYFDLWLNEKAVPVLWSLAGWKSCTLIYGLIHFCTLFYGQLRRYSYKCKIIFANFLLLQFDCGSFCLRILSYTILLQINNFYLWIFNHYFCFQDVQNVSNLILFCMNKNINNLGLNSNTYSLIRLKKVNTQLKIWSNSTVYIEQIFHL